MPSPSARPSPSPSPTRDPAELVVAPIREAYTTLGGASTWGEPGEAQCGLPGGGCVQEFAHGTIFVRPADGAVGSTTATGPSGRLIAAAEPEVGYASKTGPYTVNSSKYSQWLGWKGPWCHIFLEWVGDQVGLGETIGHYGPLFRFIDHMRADFDRVDGPQVGAFALMSTTDTFSHIGVVTDVAADGGSYTVIEGNQELGKGPKSVLKRAVKVTDRLPTEFWMPRY
jgi:hypothetical protein